MTRIKVAHITTIDLSLRYLLLDQLQAIEAAGYEVVGISAPGPDVPAIEAAGIRHIPVAMTRNLSPLRDLVTLVRLYRLMRRERFTIVHTHTPKPGLFGQLAARLARVPVVLNTLHGFYFHDAMPSRSRRFYIALEKIAAQCSDVILSQNSEDIRTAIREGIAPADTITLLGNGIDLRAFNADRFSAEELRRRREDLGIPPDAKVVGFVGRLSARRKGFLDFLRAGEQVARRCPNVRFLIVGEADPGKADAVEPEAARQYGIWDRCRFVGRLPNDELPACYALMDVLVLPSLFEGLPRVIMEASAMGVPAVASNVKGNREAVEDGRTGLLVPLGDVPALADAILDLLSGGERARRMGEEARKLAGERFDQRLVFARVLEEYERLLQEKGLLRPADETLLAALDGAAIPERSDRA